MSALSYDGMTDLTSITSVSQAGCDDDVLHAVSPGFESDRMLQDAKDAGDPLDAADDTVTALHAARKRATLIQYIHMHPMPLTAFGVLLIGIAVAVLWKVKELLALEIIFQQFHTSFSSFNDNLRCVSGHHVGFDFSITDHFSELVDGGGSISTHDFGFSGLDVGKHTVVVGGHNWDDFRSP
ncbi:hypothetical protein BDN71DRAFT_1512949 [Pleurotus eryngii]|uniref:Uncharacterized protein n=1 Tax=Pleurotus eryngii TaxID=5323 RepID=A0A9P5ZK59_PLEER|nr:hypothetical protein BDN71DRAFT_1512949 [Pleurotus eryngii]